MHANFIENAGGATSADAIALMAEARRRAHEHFGVGLEHEVQLVGGLALPPVCVRQPGGPGVAVANPGSVAEGTTGQGSRLRARAETPSSRFRARAVANASSSAGSSPRPARCPWASACSAPRVVAYVVALATGLFAVRTIAVDGVRGAVAADVRTALAEANGSSLVGLDLVELRARVEALPTVQSATFDRAFPHTLAVAVSPERGRPCCVAAPTRGSSPSAAA